MFNQFFLTFNVFAIIFSCDANKNSTTVDPPYLRGGNFVRLPGPPTPLGPPAGGHQGLSLITPRSLTAPPIHRNLQNDATNIIETELTSDQTSQLGSETGSLADNPPESEAQDGRFPAEGLPVNAGSSGGASSPETLESEHYVILTEKFGWEQAFEKCHALGFLVANIRGVQEITEVHDLLARVDSSKQNAWVNSWNGDSFRCGSCLGEYVDSKGTVTGTIVPVPQCTPSFVVCQKKQENTPPQCKEPGPQPVLPVTPVVPAPPKVPVIHVVPAPPAVPVVSGQPAFAYVTTECTHPI